MIEDKKTEKRMAFFERFTALLNGNVKEKAQEVKEGEEFCDSLKWNVTRLVEEVYKLDFLNDSFDLSSFVNENIVSPIERMKIQMDKPWLKNKLTIGLMGHFNSGKTTALNLIFNENFATRNRENTALATYLVYGSNTAKITIVDKGSKSQLIDVADSDLFDYAQGIKNFPFARIFDYLVKESSNKVLEQLTFIDTPGLSSTNEHSEPTMNAVLSCDAIFWFINLTEGVAKNDIQFIKNNLDGKPIFVVLSFADDVESLDKSVSVARNEFKKAGIEVKAFFLLGRNKTMQSEFKNLVSSKLEEITRDFEVYNPYAHIYQVVLGMQKILLDAQKALTDEHSRLDKETDQLADSYKDSQRRYESACSNCVGRLNNMIDTFNSRCANAMFCGGASGALSSDINVVVDSLGKMGTAYDAIDIQKLVEYGQLISKMGYLEMKLEKSAEILEEVKQLIKIFED